MTDWYDMSFFLDTRRQSWWPRIYRSGMKNNKYDNITANKKMLRVLLRVSRWRMTMAAMETFMVIPMEQKMHLITNNNRKTESTIFIIMPRFFRY